MWVEEEINAKGKKQYRFREYFFDKLTGKKKTVSITYAKNNKRIRERALLELNERIDQKQQPAAVVMTFGELAKDCLVDYKRKRKHSSYRNRKSDIKKINETFEHVLLEQLDYADFNYFLRGLQREGLKKSTVSSYQASINIVLDHGYNLGYLRDRTIKENIKMPEYGTELKSDVNYLEQHELDDVIEQLRDLGYEDIARMCLLQTYTGTRHGELIGIDYERQIDWDKKQILIDRTYVDSGKVYNIPKNNTIRTININDKTIRLLKEQIQYSQLQTLNKGLDKRPILFKNTIGDPNPASFINTYRLKKIESTKNISTHIFRHTFIARMAEKGVDIQLVAKHVGNTPKTIQGYYTHFTEKMDEQLSGAVDQLNFGS